MADSKIAYRTVNVDGVDIFYREAGPKDAPTVLLFHALSSMYVGKSAPLSPSATDHRRSSRWIRVAHPHALGLGYAVA